MATPNQEIFELTISSDGVVSTDRRFTMDSLGLGDNYKPLDAYFKGADGREIRRAHHKKEQKISNKTLPRIACQVFEKQLAALPVDEKESFPVCKYEPTSETIRGIYSSTEEFRRKRRNSLEYVAYRYGGGRQFVFYCWNIFSTVIFVQECLRRFGGPGDRFILSYREKDEKETQAADTGAAAWQEPARQFQGYRNPFSSMLVESKNLILRGAPGTGKTYLAKEIAADIISNGHFDDYALLTEEQKKQVEFVQFHPSYDYSDFVEGLRPKINGDGTMGFELRDGIFKRFVARARKNYEDSRPEERKKYIFIIDEINRGEISKIFGELFFAIDPGYRGRAGEVSTQYAGLRPDPEEKFFIPENVYIIGTMNDIDRSVDSFDFAMRRRFRFVELKAGERLEMLASLENGDLEAEAVRRMAALNGEIAKTEDLNENYQIGASYFLKLKTLTFNRLWTDHLQPLLREYVQGMYGEEGLMDRFARAYGYQGPSEGGTDEDPQDQG